MSDLERVLGELARLLRRSGDLPQDAFEERAAAQARREELQSLAASMRDVARAPGRPEPGQR